MAGGVGWRRIRPLRSSVVLFVRNRRIVIGNAIGLTVILIAVVRFLVGRVESLSGVNL